MSIVSLDSRGRITIPKEIRSKLKSKKFLIVLDGKNIVLIPVPELNDLKGSLKIPWTIEELEEAGEKFVTKRS
ncbi:MAG: AbrB/MazE/SpoVT family DNA-binding domain-containing protein [Candidatus Odinarchaeota archaeon]|nr:AbrB/MazE/SpoVT family DNA-binding domain-containing protein [Candidatus Odinarchaeota archaeon]